MPQFVSSVTGFPRRRVVAAGGASAALHLRERVGQAHRLPAHRYPQRRQRTDPDLWRGQRTCTRPTWRRQDRHDDRLPRQLDDRPAQPNLVVGVWVATPTTNPCRGSRASPARRRSGTVSWMSHIRASLIRSSSGPQAWTKWRSVPSRATYRGRLLTQDHRALLQGPNPQHRAICTCV